MNAPYKQTIFTAIFIFAFCFAAFAQANENPCPKINIKAPENTQPDETFKVFASFEKENQPSTSKFNWTIIDESEVFNKVSKINDRGVIELDSKKLKDGGMIIVLAQATNQKCQNIAMAKIYVVPNVGSPYIIDQYSKQDWNDENARLDNVIAVLQDYKDAGIYAIFEFDKKTSHVERKNHLSNVLNHLSIRGLEKNRITFLVSEADNENIRYQLVPKKFSDRYFCDDCLVIKAKDFQNLEKLFQLKPITKKRKK